MTLHAESIGGHTLCGMAFDAFESNDSEEPIIFAKPGETVTCEECLHHIRWVKLAFHNNKYYPEKFKS